MNSKSFDYLDRFIEDLPIISSHEHHLPDEFQKGMTLDGILNNSYLSWFTDNDFGPIPLPGYKNKYYLPEDNPNSDINRNREAFLDIFGFTGYWIWLEKGIQKIYGIDHRITSENWEGISIKISKEHENSFHHIRILRETGGYLRAIQDAYWDYGSDLGYPDFFSPTMRTDMFIMSSHPSILDADHNSPFIKFPDAPTDNFFDYLEFIKGMYIEWRNNGAVAMKCAVAYQRPISFNQIPIEKACKIFYLPEEQISVHDRLDYGDFMFNWFCELNQELEIPFQIHTGLANLSGSNPMLFEPVIKRYPRIQFVLFHAGYPWLAEVSGLAHNHRNVFIDMVWVPLISTSAAISALHNYIDITTSDAIGWGGDTWTSEEAIGSVMAWKFIVKMVLSEKIDYKMIDFRQAEALAEKLMYKNNAKLYKL